jgi:protein SCO1
MKTFFFLIILLIIPQVQLRSQDLYTIDEKPGNILPQGIYLTDEDSTRVELRSLIDRPTLLAFVYYRCPGLCSPLMTGIAEMIDKSNLKAGKDYRIICISFNPDEKPQLARNKKKNQYRVMKKSIPPDAWHFLTGDSASIATLTGIAGFEFEEVGKDYIHSAGLIVIAPSGTITQYMLGTFFLPHEMEWAVSNARKDQPVTSRINTAKYCYPEEPKPRSINESIIVFGVGIFVLVEIIILLLLNLRKKT